MGSNLNDLQLNIDCYMQKTLYSNLMITTNQKPLINIQRIKRKKSKHITKENQKSWEKDKKGPEKVFRNNHKTSNKMAINTYLSIITLNVNGQSAPIKSHRVLEWIQEKKKRPIYMLPTKDSF